MRLPRPSRTGAFTGLNIIVALFFLSAYFDLFPAFSNHHKHISDRIVDNETAIFASDAISFKDITLKFNFLHFPQPIADVCQGGNLTLLVVVQSAPTNFEMRQAIRATWANKTAVPSLENLSAMVVFLVGNGEIASKDLLKEMDTHKDIIAVDAEDSYSNLIFKSAITLYMSQTRCQTPFLLKVDEDVVFNIERFMNAIDTTFPAHYPAIYCYVWKNARIFRDRKNAWFVSERQFRNHTFPDFCSGPSYVLTSTAVSSVLRALPSFNLITVEDAFLTGIVAESARVKRIGMKDRFKSDYTVLEVTSKSCPGKLLSVHNLKSDKNMREMWNFLSKNC